MTQVGRNEKRKFYRASVFDPSSSQPFKVSRTKIELFLRCPCCFYLSQRLNIKLRDEAHYSLNLALDRLVKDGSDRLRLAQQVNPLALKYGISAVPFDHPNMKDWLFGFKGIEYLHQPTNLVIYGAPDEIWLVDNTELSIVDAKATSSKKESVEQSSFWESYKNQVELYSWLLAKQNLLHPVSSTSYFIYANTKPEQNYDNSENLSLEFQLKIIPYNGSTDWIESTLVALKECLMQKTVPMPNKKCWACQYRVKAAKIKGQKIRA